MRRGWLGPLLLGFASVVFLIIAFVPRTPGKTLDTTYLVLGIVFFVLALGSYRRLRTPLPVDTDPRLPVSKTHQKRDR
jgi:hypothetical protein